MLGFETVDDGEIFHTVKFIEDVPLIMIVEIGRTEMEVQKVLNLKKGSMLVFEKIVGEPMDVVVGNRLMARGEIVVVNERYGVRISEVTRPDEKNRRTTRVKSNARTLRPPVFFFITTTRCFTKIPHPAKFIHEHN